MLLFKHLLRIGLSEGTGRLQTLADELKSRGEGSGTLSLFDLWYDR